MPITHKFVSAKADAADPTIVRPSDWNDTHLVNLVPSEADLSVLWSFTGGLTTIGPITNPTDVTNKDYVDTVVATASRQSDYSFGLLGRVPDVIASRYLAIGSTPTSATPLIIDTGSTLRGGTLSVNGVDSSRTYSLEVLVNGLVVETITLPLATAKVTTSGFTTLLVVGDEIAIRVTRLTGTGSSTFHRALATLQITEN